MIRIRVFLKPEHLFLLKQEGFGCFNGDDKVKIVFDEFVRRNWAKVEMIERSPSGKTFYSVTEQGKDIYRIMMESLQKFIDETESED